MSLPDNTPDPIAHLRHDLRTPINQIIGYSEMLEEDAACQTSAVSDLRRIQVAARQLLSLVNTRINPELLTAGLPATTGSRTIAHRPSKVPGVDIPGDTGFFSRFNGKVLIVDDNESNREMLARRLQHQAIQVKAASDGRQALDAVGNESFDLILLDVMMPEPDGYSVLQQLKTNPETRHIPVIMISALDELDSVIRCIEAGAEDYLPKPFNPILLRARINACLEKKSLRDAEQRHLRTIEESQRRLAEELAEAANYVRSIFPSPVERPLRIDWKYLPSTELGGDALGYHWIDRDHFAVYLLDVCGHGVGASLLSVTAINVIRSGSLPGTDVRDPGAVLSALNNAFLMEQQNNMYFTLWYGVYHVPSRTLHHASGGHPPALLLKPTEDGGFICERLHNPGMIIGGMENTTYSSQACVVPEGARLLVVCDGCYEVRDVEGRVMEFDEFEEYVEQHGAGPDALDQLLSWIRKRHGEGPLDDDFSIVRIQF